MSCRHLSALAALIALSTSAHADSISDYVHAEIGVGGSAYKKGGDSLWYQEPFPHDLKLTAKAFTVGLTGPIYQSEHWGVDWHLDWAWLGTIHTDAMATPDDANYSVKTKSCNGPCLPLARFKGSGHDQGFFFAIEPHYDVGSWRFGIEGGPYLHHVTWTEDVTDDRRWSNVPINLHVAYSSGWTLSYMLGASVSYKSVSLVYQYFASAGNRSDPFVPIWQGGTHMLSFRYKF